jgi:hypothetical protein
MYWKVEPRTARPRVDRLHQNTWETVSRQRMASCSQSISSIFDLLRHAYQATVIGSWRSTIHANQVFILQRDRALTWIGELSVIRSFFIGNDQDRCDNDRRVMVTQWIQSSINSCIILQIFPSVKRIGDLHGPSDRPSPCSGAGRRPRPEPSRLHPGGAHFPSIPNGENSASSGV